MPEVFEYAVVRAVPRVERGECVNVGVVLWCQAGRYLAARFRPDPARLTALDPFLDLDDLFANLDALGRVCEGGERAGPVGQLGPGERFRWLTAPRSTVVQTSPVHTGLTAEPAAELDRLVETLVAPPRPLA